jgi:hypothetical protein
MATFYLLPPRAELAHHWTDYLRRWFPGLEDPGSELLDHVIDMVQRQPTAYAVFADELPSDTDARSALSDAFGTEPGDQVLDLRDGPLPPLAEWARGQIDIFATPWAAAR